MGKSANNVVSIKEIEHDKADPIQFIGGTYSCYKKLRRKEAVGEVFTDSDLKTEFENLNENEKMRYEVASTEMKQQSTYLNASIQRFLQESNGTIT